MHWYQYSFEGTRRFRALKLWLSWKHLGTEGFARLVEHNDDLAAHLADRLREVGGFEVVEPELSVVCFRHVPDALAGAAPETVDAYQKGSAARPRGERRRVGVHHDAARANVLAGRHRQLPLGR